MKNKISAAIAVLLLPTISVAQSIKSNSSQWDGFVSGAVGITSYGDDYTSNTNGLGLRSTGPSGEARVSVAYTDKSGFGAQLDNVYTDYITYGNGASGYNNYRSSNSSFDMAAHLFYRTNKYLAGIYGQRTSYSLQYSGNGETGGYTPMDRAYFLGAEGQYYFDRATVYAQAGYQSYGYTYTYSGSGYNESSSAPSGYTAGLSGRYFVQDNWKIDLGYAFGTTSWASNYGYSSYNSTSNTKQISNLLSLGTEYRLDKSPISFFARYDYGTSSTNGNSNFNGTSYSNSLNLTANTVLIGIKITFGTGSLLEQDRRGVTLNPVNSRINAPLGYRGVS